MIGFEHQAGGDATRDWLLDCEGMYVDGPDGTIGRVVEPLYRPSSRWDRPWALAARVEAGVVAVPIEAVVSVDRQARRIRIDRPARDLLRAPNGW